MCVFFKFNNGGRKERNKAMTIRYLEHEFHEEQIRGILTGNNVKKKSSNDTHCWSHHVAFYSTRPAKATEK